MGIITPDAGLLFWMTLIFGIVFFILAKFGFPLITGMVDKRSERINKSIAQAKEAEQSLATLAQQQKALLEQTSRDQAQMLREASQTRDNIIESAKQEAQKEAARIMEQAKAQIAAEKEAALRDIRSQVSALSVDIAEKIIRRELDDSRQQMALIDKMVDEASRLEREN